MIKKALFIEKVLYLDYTLLFLFDKIISQSIYVQNRLKLHIWIINKKINNHFLIRDGL